MCNLQRITNNMIAEQTYPGKEDYKQHFDYVLKAFKDPRYIKVDGKPIFVVFAPNEIPNCKTEFIDYWQQLAKDNGLKGIHFVGYTETTGKLLSGVKGIHSAFPIDQAAHFYNNVLEKGFDAVSSMGFYRVENILQGKYMFLLKRRLYNKYRCSVITRFDYEKAMNNYYVEEDKWENVYPSLIPQWDRSPRSAGLNGIYVNSTPDKFKNAIQKALKMIENKDDEHKILFLKSWNEWAEGNYVEPDLKFGMGYINAIKESIQQK